MAWQIGLAAVDRQVALNFLPDDQAARLAAAEGALTAALSLAPENALAHLLLGVVQMHTNRASEGVRTCERALQLDRNLAAAHAQRAEDRSDLVGAEPPQAELAAALEQLMDREVALEDEVAATLDLRDGGEA